MRFAEQNNIYGILQCHGRLNEVAKLVSSAMSLAESEIHIKTSGFDGAQKLFIRTFNAEFEAYFTNVDGELFFNGAVAGPLEEVMRLVQRLHGVFNAAGFVPMFEIYDDSRNCVAQFSA